MPLLTMTPTSITKPIREMTLTSTPASSRARKPPVTITRYTSTMPSSSISSSCPIASMMASFSPWKAAVTPWGSSAWPMTFSAAEVTLVTL